MGASEDATTQITPKAISQAKSPHDKLSQDVAQNTSSTRLTFLQKYFTKPAPLDIDTSTESGQYTDDRHFSFTSRGFLVVAAMMSLALIAAIAVAAVVGTQAHHRQPPPDDPRLKLPPPDTGHQSPIRSAILANFPDPSLWYNNGTWYAYATNNAAGIKHVENSNASEHTAAFGEANVQMATSNDFINWTIASLAHQPLPTVGAWSTGIKTSVGQLSGTWAPGVGRRADGKYVLFYASPHAGANPFPHHPHPHCVGAAVSTEDSPSGPYEAQEDALACPIDRGGAIDPEAYFENSTLWVVYKVDGNNIGNGGECEYKATFRRNFQMLIIHAQVVIPLSQSSIHRLCCKRCSRTESLEMASR